MAYVRIRQPKNKAQDVPQSLTINKIKIVQGGPGVEVKDTGFMGRAKKIIGAGNIETSKEPFKTEAPKRGGMIDMSAKEMKYPAEESETPPETAEPEAAEEKTTDKKGK